MMGQLQIILQNNYVFGGVINVKLWILQNLALSILGMFVIKFKHVCGFGGLRLVLVIHVATKFPVRVSLSLNSTNLWHVRLVKKVVKEYVKKQLQKTLLGLSAVNW